MSIPTFGSGKNLSRANDFASALDKDHNDHPGIKDFAASIVQNFEEGDSKRYPHISGLHEGTFKKTPATTMEFFKEIINLLDRKENKIQPNSIKRLLKGLNFTEPLGIKNGFAAWWSEGGGTGKKRLRSMLKIAFELHEHVKENPHKKIEYAAHLHITPSDEELRTIKVTGSLIGSTGVSKVQVAGASSSQSAEKADMTNAQKKNHERAGMLISLILGSKGEAKTTHQLFQKIKNRYKYLDGKNFRDTYPSIDRYILWGQEKKKIRALKLLKK